MTDTFKLKITKQCAKCPWKVSTNPHDIPDGYDVEKHKALKNTIAQDASFGSVLKIMSCHHEDESPCIGWLHNQMGSGNNISLRIKMMKCENIRDVKIYGKQHETFEQTLPQN